jgi:hypothetical protein
MSIMLPKDFDTLAESARAFGLADAVRSLGQFVRAHPRWELIDTRDLHQLPIDRYTLTRAVVYLVNAGVFRQLYAVTTPSGSLADGLFETPRDIPQKLPDRFHSFYFDTADQDIIPILVAGTRR